MCPAHLQNWSDLGHGLLIFLLLALLWLGNILHTDVSWPPSELIRLWLCSVDFPHCGSFLNKWNWSYLGSQGIIWRTPRSKCRGAEASFRRFASRSVLLFAAEWVGKTSCCSWWLSDWLVRSLLQRPRTYQRSALLTLCERNPPLVAAFSLQRNSSTERISMPWRKNVYVMELTHWVRVTHICVSKLTTIGSYNGLSPGRRRATNWSNAVNSNLRNKFQRNLKRNSYIFSQENPFENVVCEMAAILSRGKWVNEGKPFQNSVNNAINKLWYLGKVWILQMTSRGWQASYRCPIHTFSTHWARQNVRHFFFQTHFHPRKCLYQSWWRHQIETFAALLTICAGNSPVTGEFPA